MSNPQLTTAGLQQTDGAHQQITVEGMTAWINMVRGYRVSAAGKKRLFEQSREDLIATSRRDVE